MATTTTNYGFDIPQSTDLVKDGATAIATLGQDIDTAMNTALGTKKAGMVLLNTTSFSAVSSISFPANVFSATYKNYRLVANVIQTSSGVLSIRWRTAGSDNSAATYYDFFAKSATNSASFASNFNNGGISSIFSDSTSGTDSLKTFNFDIFSPFESQRTYYSGNVVTSANSQAQPYYGGFAFGGFNNTTSFDSMTLFPPSGTITGSMSIYGYNS
jgi:hypothetical protein